MSCCRTLRPASCASPSCASFNGPARFRLNFSPSDATAWATIGDLASPSYALAESPLQSPNVFFFFQPGYIPPQTGLETNGITAPEFGITNESAVAGYMNFVKKLVATGIGGVLGTTARCSP